MSPCGEHDVACTGGRREGEGGRSWTARIVLAAALAIALLPTGTATPAEAQVMDRETYVYLALNELEYAPGLDERPLVVDAEAWIGGDYNRIWIEAAGEHATVGGGGEYEAQLLFGRFVAPYWDARAGVRFDVERAGGGTDTRPHLALGLKGMAPYWFEVEPTVFVSRDGDVSARLEAAYDLLLTQRLIVEPELETSVAVQEVPEWGVGSGFNDVELSARLRYEVIRELAPYVGVSWHRLLGRTADLARAAGGEVGEAAFVLGFRGWW